MKTILFKLTNLSSLVLIAMLVLGIQSTNAQQSNKYLFVLAGQSNMVGSSNQSFNKPEEISKEDWRTNTGLTRGGITVDEKNHELTHDYAIWKKKIAGRVKHWQANTSDPSKGKFVDVIFGSPINLRENIYMNDPVYNTPTGPTLGVSFAIQFLANHSDPLAEVYLVGAATGATGFSQAAADWFKNQKKPLPVRTWSPFIFAAHNLQDIMINNTKAAAASIPNIKIGGMLWLQGESDSSMTMWNYSTAVQSMVYRFRTEIPNALYSTFYLATMMPQVGQNPKSYPPIYSSTIDEAHRRIIPNYSKKYKTGVYNAKLVDTFYMNDNIQKYQSPCERVNPQPACLNPDSETKYTPFRVHYSAFALRQIGRKFANLASQ